MMRLRLSRWPAFALAVAIAPTAAHAVDLPDPVTFDAGPLGTLELSGGADGYAYALTGAGDGTNKGLLGTSTSVGVQFLNGLIQLDKPDGLLRFTVAGRRGQLAHSGHQAGTAVGADVVHLAGAHRIRHSGADIGFHDLGGPDGIG